MAYTDKEKLWDKYKSTHDIEIRNQLIVEYAPLVKLVAGRLSMYLGNNVEYEDLCSFGIMGLIDSVDKFDSSMKVKFETYASLRIRGSIIDQIRRLDWIPRSLREKQKVYNKAEDELFAELGRKPTDSELIERLGITEDEYYLNQSKLVGTTIISMDDDSQNKANNSNYSLSDTLKQCTFESPEGSLLKEELRKKLSLALSELTDKERKVVELYYYEELTLREISHVLGVSESRISQLHMKALVKLREHLGEYMGFLYNTV